MKRNDILITIGTLAYSILFYKQLAGINFLVFNIFLTAMWAVKKPELLRSKGWLLMAVSALFTSFCIVWQGTNLAVIANIVALILLAAYSMNPKSSVIFNFFFSFYSIMGSFVFIILRLVDPAFREKKEVNEEKIGKGFSWKKFLTFFLPFVVIIIFFVIYRAANPLFKKFTNEINLDFISLPWIGFTFLGFLLLCGFFYQYRIKAMDNWEMNKPKHLEFSENHKMLKWINEKNAALFLFAMMNFMLLFINGVDINYLYLGAGLPKEITHAGFVHDGVGMLILSILIAISLMLFFFRGNMNFENNAKWVRVLVYFWIAQNIMMVVSTILRNNIYVEEYQLTYKRIGVYVYLTLAIVGLLTTFYKIFDKRTNWFLFRSNSMAGIMLLFVCSAIDFDMLVTNYNIKHAKNIASLDKTYLLSLSETNIPALYEIKNEAGFNNTSSYHYSRFFNLADEANGYYGENKKVLDQKLLSFLQGNNGYGWRSWNNRRARIYREIERLNKEGKINSLDYSNTRPQDLSVLAILKNLKEINLASSFYTNWNHLQNFPILEKLNVQSCGITNFDSFPQMKRLREIILTGNFLYDFSRMDKFSLLEKIELASYTGDLNNFPVFENLKEINLQYGSFKNLNALKKQKSLAKLDFTGGRCDVAFPSLPQLRSIYLTNNKYTFRDSLVKTLSALPNLEELVLIDNDLSDISFFYKNNPDKSFSPIFANLVKLDVSNNQIALAEKLFLFTKLQELNLGRNKLQFVPEIKNLTDLKKLNISSNFITVLPDLSPLVNLEELNVSDNYSLKDFSPLKNLIGLKKLQISQCGFNDLSLLYGMKNLKVLEIDNTSVANLSGIEKISSLTELKLSSLKLADVDRLSKLKNLKKVIVDAILPDVKEKFEKTLIGVKLEVRVVEETRAE